MNNKIPAGDALYRLLQTQNIKHVFGLLGGSMLELYDAMYRGGDIDYIGARDERAAGHMADAYSRITHQPAIVLGAQAGPGVVNLTTPIVEAYYAYSPVVALAGAISRKDLGKDTFQEVDQVQLFKPIAKASILVTDASRLCDMVTDAMRLAMCNRKGPVVVHIPRDIFQEMVDAPPLEKISFAAQGIPTHDELLTIIEALARAKKPVIFAGSAFKNNEGSKVLCAFAEKVNIPVVCATGHADIMPHHHRLNAGQNGPRGNWVARKLCLHSDMILALGTRLAFNSTFLSHEYLSKDAELIHIDCDARYIGRYFKTTIGFEADSVKTCQALSACAGKIDPRAWQEWVEQFQHDKVTLQRERTAEANDESLPMLPTKALGDIRALLPDDAIVTLDTGNACLQAADRMKHCHAPSLITPLDFGLVGFGYAAALGAKAAASTQPVVSIMGDGGFGFTMIEIATAVEYQLNVIAIILDNEAWGAEKAYQRSFFGNRLLGADIQGPEYDEVARSCGALGFKANNSDELKDALRQALNARQPAVIHVKINKHALNALRKDLFITEK